MRFLHAGLVLLIASALQPCDRGAAGSLTSPQSAGEPVAPRKMLYAYLQAEAQKHFDARRQAVAALKTPDAVRKRQADLKAKFLAALGGFPEKTPLNPQVVGTIQGDGFTVEKLIYENRPGHHVTANLYLPEGKGPFPGVLVPCGHSANGKAAEAYQRASILLAKNGLAALCYDPIGQGERAQILDKMGKPMLGSTTEHTLVGIGALLVGQSTATYRIWDGIRSLDYLASRKEVDPKRLGCTGNSGGGTLTAYLMALDDRIVCAAPSCYITSLERLFATLGPQDAEQNITGQVAFGMEHADYVTMRAPLPTLICTGTQDFFDIQGSWTTFREANLIYGMLGHGERVSLFEYNDKHGFSKPRREAAMRWMRRWLLHKDDAPVEGNWPVFKDADLQCTRSGQVLEDFKGKSVIHLNTERAKALAAARANLHAKMARADLLAAVRNLLALPPDVPAPKTHARKRQEPQRGLLVDHFTFDTEPGIRATGTLFSAPKEDQKTLPLVLLLGDEASKGGPSAEVERIVKAGKRVLVLDPRGMGESAPGIPSTKKPSYFGVDFKETFLSIHLNRPILGQRVYDVLSVLNDLHRKWWIDEVHIVGVGSAGPIALHAAALDPKIKSLQLERSLTSWTDVVRAPISYNQLTNVVPGALTVYDLPELAGLLAPRPLKIKDAVDPANRIASKEDVERAYTACRASYTKENAEGRFVIQTEE